MSITQQKLRKKCEEHPTSCSSKKVFLINFHLAWRFFKINSWLGKFKEHLIKIIKLLSITSEIQLSSYGKLCLYNNQTTRFPHKLSFWMYYADMIVGKDVPFLLQAGWRMGTAQLAGKKRTPFSKNKIFKNVSWGALQMRTYAHTPSYVYIHTYIYIYIYIYIILYMRNAMICL